MNTPVIERKRVKLIEMLEEEQGELEDTLAAILNISIDDTEYSIRRELNSTEFSNMRVLELESSDKDGNIFVDRIEISVEHVRRIKEL